MTTRERNTQFVFTTGAAVDHAVSQHRSDRLLHRPDIDFTGMHSLCHGHSARLVICPKAEHDGSPVAGDKSPVTNRFTWMTSSSGPQPASCWADVSAMCSFTTSQPSWRTRCAPLEIWNGGMSFHGGLLGTTIAMILFARKNGIPVWSMFDIIAAVAPVGPVLRAHRKFYQRRIMGPPDGCSVGRRVPDRWALCPSSKPALRSGLEGIVLLLVLSVMIWAFRALKAPAHVTGTFVAGYALSRIFVEFFREPDAQIGYLAGNWLTMGMVLSAPIVRAWRLGHPSCALRCQRPAERISAMPTPLARRIKSLIRPQRPLERHRLFLALPRRSRAWLLQDAPTLRRTGDFVTAPEVSQLFGEMLGVFMVQPGSAMSLPANVRLVEIGPGRGTMRRTCCVSSSALPRLYTTP